MEVTVMMDHCGEHFEGNDRAEHGGGVGALIALAILTAACAAGLWYAISALAAPDLEWRTLALAALALALSPLSAEIGAKGRGRVRLPLSHAALFAGVLSLGPGGAALCAVFRGIGALAFPPSADRSIRKVAVTVLKPAGVCAAAALVFEASGGSSSHPCDVASILPSVYSSLAYVLAGVAMAAASCRIRRLELGLAPRRAPLGAAWLACCTGGYLLAALYSVAPTYVLLAPVVAAGLMYVAMGGEERGAGRAAADSRETPDTASPEPAGDSAVFIDPSTGLANRRYLEMFVRSELGRSERMGKRMSLAVFDIDGLPKLLDSGGREPLDDAVGEIAARLRSGLREYDVLARYSAGRIAAVLPEIGSNQAFEVAERLHRSLESVRLADSPVSVSVGIASFPEHAHTVEDLINSAHHALNRGRFESPNSVYVCERLDRAS